MTPNCANGWELKKQNLKIKRIANKSWLDLIFKKHSVSLNLK